MKMEHAGAAKWRVPALSWESLRSLGESRLLRTSYFWIAFVPLCAKLFYHVHEVKIRLFDQEWHLDISLPFSWQFFFFSSTAFALATILYSAFCPRIIKEYRSAAEFFGAGGTRGNLQDHVKSLSRCGRIWESNKSWRQAGYIIGDCVRDHYLDLSAHDARGDIADGYGRSVPMETIDRQTKEAFAHIRRLAGRRDYWVRLGSCLLYLVGFVLLAIVFCQNVKYVIQQM